MLKNIINTLFTRGAVAIFNFLILLLTSRYLGSAVLGEISVLILSITIIQTVNEIYTGSALVYFIPKSRLWPIYRNGLLFTLVCILLLNAAFVLLHIGNPALSLHVCLLSFMITLNAFHNVCILACEKIVWYNRIQFLQPFLLMLTLAIGIFVLKRAELSTYLFALYLSFGLTLLVSGALVASLHRRKQSGTDPSLTSILRNGFLNQLGNLAHTLSNRLNYYLLGSSAVVGVYAGSTSLIESLWIISGSVSPVILTHIANQNDSGNNSRLTFLLAKLCFLLSAFCVLVLLFLPAGFFTALLGHDFTETKQIMLYLSPGVLAISFSSILSHYFSALGNQRILFIANSAGLATTLLSAFPLIKLFGIYGACYSASLSYFMQSLVLTVVFMQGRNLHFSDLFRFRADLRLLR